MRKRVLIAGVMLTPFLLAGSALAQAGTIGIFADVNGTQSSYYDDTPGMFSLYVVHVASAEATACEFAAPVPSCFTAEYLSDTAVFPVTVGNSQNSVSIGYGTCRSSPIHVLTINFFGYGTSGDCCAYSVVDGRNGTEVVPIRITDCTGPPPTAHSAAGGTIVINPGECECEHPSLTLDGYQSVGWNDPFWTVQVQVQNSGVGEAFNVSATMHEDIPWLINVDADCYYGDLPSGGSSWGGLDTYVFNLADHPGGSFNVWFDVRYQDDCGNTHTIRLDPEFDVDATKAGAPDDTPVISRALGQNYPNPFNPATTIPLYFAEATRARLALFDSQGKVVRVLLDGPVPAGTQPVVWDGYDANGNAVGSGIYFARLIAGATTETRKLVLLK